MSCPLCTLPEREGTLYADDTCYIAKTKTPKGHLLRIMCVINRHVADPNMKEFTHSLSVLRDYMEKNCPTENFYLVFGTHGSIPEHYHVIGCDDIFNQEEAALMFDSDYVRCLIYGNKRKVLVGIPAHNEADNISSVIAQAKKFGDVLVVENGSTDKTAEVARSAGAIVESFTWSGYGRALQQIFKEARDNKYDYLITLDSDGQHNPTEIPRFLTALRSTNVVVGNRFLENDTTPVHRAAVIKTLNSIYGVGDTQCGFRGYDSKAINTIDIVDNGMGASLEILTKAKEHRLTISDVPCTVKYAAAQEAGKLLNQGLRLIESVYWGLIWARPFTIIGIPAFLSMIISILSGIYALTKYFATGYLVPSIALLSGITLIVSLVLGLMAFFVTTQRRLLKELKLNG